MRNVIRTFSTDHFRVVLTYDYEQDSDLSWDDTGEVRAKIKSGEWENYCFAVRVYFDGIEVAADYLGNSIYADPREFSREHIGLAAKSRADGVRYGCYFPDMVRNVTSEARKRVAKLQSVRLRN